MNQRTDVAERRRAPGSAPGQRRAPGPRAQASAGTGALAEARTRVAAGAPAKARTRPPGGTRTAGITRSPVAPRPAARGRTAPQARTRFVFLVVALLGGGLLCLLLVNTIMATGAFKITALQQSNVALAQRDQALQAQIATEEAPTALAQRARALGMVAPPLTHFLDLRTGRIISQPRQMPGIPTVPGYAP